MGTKARYERGSLLFFNGTDFETERAFAPVVFYDDFLGTSGAHVASTSANWTLIDAGAATEALVADEANGVWANSLTSGDEAQQAGISWGDQRPLVAGQGLVFEARVKISTTPTLVAEAVWGLASDTAAVNDDVANNAWFKVDGSTSVLAESDNGTTDTDDTDTSVVAGTTTWRVYRIDACDAANVKFYIDGNRVCASTTFSLLTTTLLQPYFHIVKASGAGVGVMKIDYCRVWQNRS